MNRLLCWLGFHSMQVVDHVQYIATGHYDLECRRCQKFERVFTWWGMPL